MISLLVYMTSMTRCIIDKVVMLVYKFDVLAIVRVIVRIALQKYEIKSTGNCVCEKLILCLN
jgi:hypothetical protein